MYVPARMYMLAPVLVCTLPVQVGGDLACLSAPTVGPSQPDGWSQPVSVR